MADTKPVTGDELRKLVRVRRYWNEDEVAARDLERAASTLDAQAAELVDLQKHFDLLADQHEAMNTACLEYSTELARLRAPVGDDVVDLIEAELAKWRDTYASAGSAGEHDRLGGLILKLRARFRQLTDALAEANARTQDALDDVRRYREIADEWRTLCAEVEAKAASGTTLYIIGADYHYESDAPPLLLFATPTEETEQALLSELRRLWNDGSPLIPEDYDIRSWRVSLVASPEDIGPTIAAAQTETEEAESDATK